MIKIMKEEKEREEAQKTLDRAEALLNAERYDKAVKEFNKAAEMYFELHEYLVAEQCYFYAAKALVHEEDYLEASNSMRDSANCCISLDNYSKAGEYYDLAAKYALKSSKKEAEFRSILSACFAYLCLFLKGQQDKGLAFIKHIKKHVDSKEFAENKLVRLVKGLTLAVLNQDDSALKLIEEDFMNYKFRDSETKLIKDTILMAKTHLLLKFDLNVDKKELLNEEIIPFSLKIDFSGLIRLVDDPYLKHHFRSIKLIDFGVALSDNLSIKEKPDLPIMLKGATEELNFKVRANFPGDGFIGPVVFTIELDEKLYFYAKSAVCKVLVKSPPVKLGVDLKPMTNPIINQTFPLEVTLTNPSDSDAVNIEIAFEFPVGLRLMRGTTDKQIFQLIRGDDFKWQLSLKPLEPGKHIIKVTMSFSDQDGKVIGPNTAELPLEINL
jgi:tetratricopeptide (TPR) repeat protein